MKSIQNKKIMVIASVVMAISLPSYTIQKKTVRALSVSLATICTLISYKMWPTIKSEVHPAIVGATSIIIPVSVYSYLYSFTPEYRLKRANQELDQLMHHKLIKYSLNNNRAFFDTIHDVYLKHDLPLISAYNHLIRLLPKVNDTFILLNKVKSEIRNNRMLKQQFICTLLRAKKVFKNISHAVKRIREHKDYLPQLQIYKEFLSDDKHTALK